MTKEAKFKMRPERLEELKEELKYLQTVREKEVAEQIKVARSFGDLSENSEYDEAKIEQGKLYSKIAEIKNVIDNAELVTFTGDVESVTVGSTVTVLDHDGGFEENYQIVGSQDADPMANLISDESPLGKGLMGKKIGDEVTVEAPAGTLKFKVLNIQIT